MGNISKTPRLKQSSGNDSLIYEKIDLLIKSLPKDGADIKRFYTELFRLVELFAFQNGYYNTRELIVQIGLDISRTDNNGFDALMLASKNGYFHIVEMLLISGADLFRVNINGFDALMLASKNGHTKVAKLLLKYKANIGYVDKFGWDALMFASNFGHIKMVKILLKKGADIKRINNIGWDALMLASHNGHTKIANILLKYGANIHRADIYGRGAFMYASRFGHHKTAEFLIKSGADKKRVDLYGNDALMLASHNGHIETVRYLLKHWSDITCVNTNGLDALMLASQNGQIKTVHLLLRTVVDFYVFKSHRWKEKITPSQSILSYAAENRNFQLCLTMCLSDVIFFNFEEDNMRLLKMITAFAGEYNYLPHFGKWISFLGMYCVHSLMSVDMVDDTYIFSKPSINDTFKTVWKTLHCYATIALLLRVNQVPDEVLVKKYVKIAMKEFPYTSYFDAIQFYICQKCLTAIYRSIDGTTQAVEFFNLLLQFKYPDLCTNYIIKENLLDTSSSKFSLPLVRDMLNIYWKGTSFSVHFSERLANCNIVELLTQYLNINKDNECSESVYITTCTIAILYNISLKKELKEYFNDGHTAKIILKMEFKNVAASIASKLLLLQIGDRKSQTETHRYMKQFLLGAIPDAIREENRGHFFISLYALVQTLVAISQADHEYDEIMSLFPSLKDILACGSTQEQEATTECFIALAKHKQGSQKIINDDSLNELLNKLKHSENKTIESNINAVFWLSGLATGVLPSKQDIMYSDEFPKKFKIDSNVIGQGAFGCIHRVIDEERPRETKFVAKEIKLKSLNDSVSCIKETTILLQAKHKRIVRLHGFKKSSESFCIFLEYMKNGTLSSFVSKRGSLNENLTRHFSVQILEGVDYLHQIHILHRDIKGSNILMEDDMNIKLADFGISEFIDGKGVPTEKGTIRYMAPEVVFTEGNVIENYTSRSDIWSVGCTVIEMLTGDPPNSSLISAQVVYSLSKGELRYKLPSSSSESLKKFLKSILKIEVKQRPSADWLLKNDNFILGK